MDKFLKVIESNLPSTENDAKQEVINQLAKLFDNIKGIKVTPIDHNSFRVVVNSNEVILNMADVRPLTEDFRDPVFSVDRGVEGLAAKAVGGSLAGALGTKIGSGAQRAKAATKKREAVAKKAITVYDNVTKDLEKAITDYAKYKPVSNPSII